MTPGMKTSEFGVMSFFQLVGGYVFNTSQSDWIKAIALIGMFSLAALYLWSRTEVKKRGS